MHSICQAVMRAWSSCSRAGAICACASAADGSRRAAGVRLVDGEPIEADAVIEEARAAGRPVAQRVGLAAKGADVGGKVLAAH